MNYRSLFITSTFAFLTLFAKESPLDDLPLSPPEEFLSRNRDSLIEGLVNPLSGQFSLHQTDLIVRGAQELRLERHYNPPHIPDFSLAKNQGEWESYYLFKHLIKDYKGWQLFPHLRLQVFPEENCVRLSDPSGITLDFEVAASKTRLLSDLCGITNTAGERPSGQYDIRNTRISIENKGTKIRVFAPDGIERVYAYESGMDSARKSYFCILKKEILPNGKVIKYRMGINGLTTIESLSPNCDHQYATLHLEGSPLRGDYRVRSSTDDSVIYHYERRPINVSIKEKKIIGNRREKIKAKFPPLLQRVSSPIYRSETIDYSERFLLNSLDSSGMPIKCHYDTFGQKDAKHYRVESLSFPTGREGLFEESCRIAYDPPIPQTKPGSTTVTHANGTHTIYRFNKELLTTSIETYDQNQILKLQKRFTWTPNHWLASLELLDGHSKPLFKRTYTYDNYGNPTSETLFGNLTGQSPNESYTIKRTFSPTHLLLKEEHDNGKVLIYTYLPKTNLLTSKFIKDRTHTLLRQFYTYG